MITYFAAFALLVATTAFAQEAVAKPCKGEVVSTDGKVAVGNCWTNNVEVQEPIARACGEGHKCEVHGDITRAHEIKRVFWATGPKGDVVQGEAVSEWDRGPREGSQWGAEMHGP